MNIQTSPSENITSYLISQKFFKSAQGKRCCSMLGDEAARKLLFDVQAWTGIFGLKLAPDRKHLTRELCGLMNWASLSTAAKTCAGMCMAHLVIQQLLPLYMHRTRSGRGSRSYWLLADHSDTTGNATKEPAGPYSLPSAGLPIHPISINYSKESTCL